MKQARTRRRDPRTLYAAVCVSAVAVLGWLLAQWATFGLLEHSHVTAAGVVEHHHPYAAPLACAAALVALASLLAVQTTPGQRSPAADSDAWFAGRVMPAAGLSAALFVLVESVELHAAGHFAHPAALAVPLLGGGLQFLTFPAARAAAHLALRAVESSARLAPEAARSSSPRRQVPIALRVTADRGRTPADAWEGRAPPFVRDYFCFHLPATPATPATAAR